MDAASQIIAEGESSVVNINADAQNNRKSKYSSHDNINRNLQFIAKFISQLAESQKNFSEQLGLSYSRVFTDGYEDFKAINPAQVIARWLSEGPKSQVKLARLLSDICKHQVALVASIDDVVSQTVEEVQKNSATFLNGKFTRYCSEIQENPHKRFNELVAPGLAKAYIRQREIQKSIK